MTRDELIAGFVAERGVLVARVAAVPEERLDQAPEGHAHSPKAIVAHITAYEELIVKRLRSSRQGITSMLMRDREGWEAFNARVWEFVETYDAAAVLADSRRVFGELLDELKQLTDDELAEPTGATAFVDPAWLGEHPPWKMIAMDGFEHYPMHYDALAASAEATPDA